MKNVIFFLSLSYVQYDNMSKLHWRMIPWSNGGGHKVYFLWKSYTSLIKEQGMTEMLHLTLNGLAWQIRDDKSKL